MLVSLPEAGGEGTVGIRTGGGGRSGQGWKAKLLVGLLEGGRVLELLPELLEGGRTAKPFTSAVEGR